MGIWYHGSPVEMDALRTGSTITQHYNLACIFSHKPSTVSISDEGVIKHNGIENGLLYIIDEPVDPLKDIEPHPRSTMGEEMEWLTKRTVKLKQLKEIGQPIIEEILTEEDIKTLEDQ
ncbi:MAG: hypothetical protein K6T94_12380 [Paenibacillus sp.]|nr:hypothetical protein [Paenibacillus sp.]